MVHFVKGIDLTFFDFPHSTKSVSLILFGSVMANMRLIVTSSFVEEETYTQKCTIRSWQITDIIASTEKSPFLSAQRLLIGEKYQFRSENEKRPNPLFLGLDRFR
jgi:hypothetical protein